jgi:Fic family protein
MFFEFDDFDVRDRFFNIDERNERLKLILEPMTPEKRKLFRDNSIQAYIYHDSALDGLVISGEEIAAVFNMEYASTLIRSRFLQEIRNHREILERIALLSERERSRDVMYQCDVVTMKDVTRLHQVLYDGITRKEPGKMRQAPPLHSSYFHHFVDDAKVESALAKLCAQTEDSEFRGQHPINQAVLFHTNFMSIYPFMEGSGKVGRILMNSFLFQGGYEAAIIASSERQRYYETLRDGPEALRDLLLDSMEASLDSQIKMATQMEELNYGPRIVHRSLHFRGEL